jgi:hypothetical protein
MVSVAMSAMLSVYDVAEAHGVEGVWLQEEKDLVEERESQRARLCGLSCQGSLQVVAIYMRTILMMFWIR